MKPQQSFGSRETCLRRYLFQVPHPVQLPDPAPTLCGPVCRAVRQRHARVHAGAPPPGRGRLHHGRGTQLPAVWMLLHARKHVLRRGLSLQSCLELEYCAHVALSAHRQNWPPHWILPSGQPLLPDHIPANWPLAIPASEGLQRADTGEYLLKTTGAHT